MSRRIKCPACQTWNEDQDYCSNCNEVLSHELKMEQAREKLREEVKITPNCFSTWTPADVYFADNYTGDSAMVRILSTKENINQMLCTVIGLNKHLEQESQKIAKMLVAFDEAGNRIKTYPSELMMALRSAGVPSNTMRPWPIT